MAAIGVRSLFGKRDLTPPKTIALMRLEPYLVKSTLCLLLASLMTTTATAATPPVPPDAARHPHVVKAPFGATRNDDYYWLRDDKRENKDMLAYLQARMPMPTSCWHR